MSAPIDEGREAMQAWGQSRRPRDAVARALSFVEPAEIAGPQRSASTSTPLTTDGIEDDRHVGPLPSRSRPTMGARPHTMFVQRPSSASTSSHLLPRPPLVRKASSAAPASLALADGQRRQGGTGESDPAPWHAKAHGDTPLDRTIDHIGMGRYQWALLLCSGTGWAADNMWLQGIAIVLPRVQRQFEVSDALIGLPSSSAFAGMMVGALAWGTYSDTYGRKGAFRGTLISVAVFGTLAAFATSLTVLCLLLFIVGLGLGGSMPTDGTIFLENLPTRKRYLLTALSVFFAAGSVASSILGLIIIPGPSNRWRWFLGSLGAVTTLFLVLRLVFFDILESPRYLVSSGRPEEAREALQKIAAYNQAPLPVALSDVSDIRVAGRLGERNDGDDDDDEGEEAGEQTLATIRPSSGGYSALPRGESDSDTITSKAIRSTGGGDGGDALSSSLASLRAKFDVLLSEPWRRTTLLVWAIWITVTLAFTMFNVFLPKFLEQRLQQPNDQDPPPSTTPHAPPSSSATTRVMIDYLLYSLASVPGAILGAYAIETRLGRKGTMAVSLSAVVLGILGFIQMQSRVAIVVSSMAISLAASVAYAAIFGYTPEVFEVNVRGTATGVSVGAGSPNARPCLCS